jgi:hypothetical protein
MFEHIEGNSTGKDSNIGIWKGFAKSLIQGRSVHRGAEGRFVLEKEKAAGGSQRRGADSFGCGPLD